MSTKTLRSINMTWTKKTIKAYLRSCHDVVRAHLAYIIRKNIVVKTYSDYPKYVTPENEMIRRMLHLHPEKISFWNVISSQ